MSEQTAMAYMRCSGASQVDRDSFPRQTIAIAACCRSKGLELAREYREEAVPGKLDEEHRPAFQQMISDMLANGCRTIVIEGMSRLAREYRTQEHLIIYIASKGITLISADTGEDITAAMMGDPMRRALVQIQGIFSELDKNLLVAKLRKARERKRTAIGKCEGQKSYGQFKIKDDDPDSLIKAETEKKALAMMRSLRAAGMSCDRIAEALNANGVPTRKRGVKNYSGLWLGCTVNRILKREDA